VTIFGYQREPYARVLADGTAEVNLRSPAAYLNKSFYGNVTVPSEADPRATPQWSVIDRTGQFEWHDHRIHWASPEQPSKVTDTGKRTLIFDWTVPITVGAASGAISGQLYWVPQHSSVPVAAIVVGVLIVLGGLALVLFVRRRRAGGGPQDPSAGGGEGEEGDSSEAVLREAW
ncbi:MAG TPA: transmembrane domain-containing protein, partial [Solirubrobacteraceae bacterium]|nr:transmembrane domain-containing protein [Solirubrobacteraceae bacterium]